MLLLFAFTPNLFSQPLVASYPFSGNAADVTGNGHNGTVTGATLTEDRFGNKNAAYNFDGINDYISVPHSPALNFPYTYSISLWVKFCGPAPIGTSSGTLFNKGLGSGKGGGYCINREAHLNSEIIGFGCHTSDGSSVVTTTLNLNDGRWHHVVGVFEANTRSPTREYYSIYLDGVLEKTLSSDPIPAYTNTLNLWIGRSNAIPAYYFQGAIDDIKLYDTMLTAAQVSTLYRENGWPTAAQPNILNLAIAASDTVICPGKTVQLSLLGNPSQVAWNPVPGLQGTTSMFPTVTPIQTTTYVVKALKIAGAEPCRDTVQKIDSIRITVRNQPKVELGLSQYVCFGDSLSFGANATDGTPPYSYQWNQHPLITNRNQLLQKVKIDRSAQFILTVTDKEGCIGRDTLNITMLSPPRMTAGRDTTICRGSTLMLGGVIEQGVPPITYTWTPSVGLSDTSDRTPIAMPDTTTRYTVMVKSSNGCIWRDTILVTVAPQPTVDAGDDLQLCADSSLVLSPVIGGRKPSLIQWTPSAGLSCTDCQNPTAQPTATTTYRVTITDSLGCTAADSVTVTVLRPVLQTPAIIDFGSLDGCTSTRDTTITLTNSGDAPITITEATVAGTSFSVTGLPITLAAGEQKTITVRFSPQSAGVTTDQLRLSGNPCAASATINLSGTKLQSLVSISVGAIDFGSAATCQQATPRDTVVMVRNNGTAPATIYPAVVSAPFSVASPSLPLTVPPGDSVQVVVRYSASGAGTFNDDLRLPFASGTCRDSLRVRLVGQAIEPKLAPLPVIDFGGLTGCQTDRDTVVMLHNTSEIEVTVTRLFSSSNQYLVSPSSVKIPANDSVAVSVSYRPSSSGNHGGTIEVEYQPCDKSMGSQLKGSKQGISITIADTLNFGRVVMCGDSTVTALLPLRFDGADGSIALATIASPFLVGSVVGTALPNGVEQKIGVSFAPPRDGAFDEKLTLHLEPCGLTKEVVVRGERITPSLRGNTLDFGTQSVGTPATGVMEFINTSDVELRVASISGVQLPFGVISSAPPLPADLKPGDTLRVSISYQPEEGEQTATATAVTLLPCEIQASATLIGNGEKNGSVTFVLPSVEASPGERVELPIRATVSGGGLAGSEATSFSGVLRFNSSLLFPVGSTPMGSVVDGERFVPIDGEIGPEFSEGEVASYEFTATLGNAEVTALKLTDLRFSKPTSATAESGEFRLNGICRFGTLRLIEAEGKLVLKPNRPNPVTWETEIEYELIEGGLTKLYVVSTLGQEVLRLVDGVARRGRYVVRFDAGVLPSGSYIYVLETPTQRLTRVMNVAK